MTINCRLLKNDKEKDLLSFSLEMSKDDLELLYNTYDLNEIFIAGGLKTKTINEDLAKSICECTVNYARSLKTKSKKNKKSK